MISREQRYCAKGVSLWFVRHALRDELAQNQDLLEVVDRTCGLGYIRKVTDVRLLGARHDVVIETEIDWGAEGCVLIDVRIDDPHDLHVANRRGLPHYEDWIANKTGAVEARAVLLAPEYYFEKVREAYDAPRAITFEEIMPLVSPHMRKILEDGIERAETQLAEYGWPRRRPLWVYARLIRQRRFG